MAAIRLEGLTKAYASGSLAVNDVSIDIADGELLVLVGPSGSGKSTVLRLIAGLELPDAGRITIGTTDVTTAPPQARDLAMVFQNYALYPHKTVRANMAFALEVRGLSPADITRRVETAAGTLGLDALLDRRPSQLSGGQRQRVALGRAIVREPRAFLLDEPLSNLDPRLRVETRAELALLHRRLAATMVYVTHDQEEAMTLGERLALMRDGIVEQVGPPLELFNRPANAFVAGFIGSPAMNLVPGRLRRDGDGGRFESEGVSVRLAAPMVDGATEVRLGVRPHDLSIGDGDETHATGHVEVVEPLGATTLLHLAVAGLAERLRVVVDVDRAPRVGDTVPVTCRRDRLHFFAGGSGARLTGFDAESA